MAGALTKTTLRGAAAVALITFAGCSGPAPHQTPPPPHSFAQSPPPALMGGAPEIADNSGLLGGPGGPGGQRAPAPSPPASTANPEHLMRLVTYRRADGVLVTAMRPIENPDHMTAAERRQTNGARYAPRAHVGGHSRNDVVAHAAPAKPAARTVVVAKPAPMIAAAKPAPQIMAVMPLSPVTPPAAPQTVVSEVAKPAPVVTAAMTPPPGGLPTPESPELAGLQTAVGGEVAAGSKLTVPEPLAEGQTALVSLSLPQTLLAMIQREAGKLGLGKAAEQADVTATLSGEGYEITPNGPQTAKLKLGEAPTFNWQVQPGAGEKGPLKADVDASLKGLKLPMTFSLASLEQAVKAALPPPAPREEGSFLNKLAIPGVPAINIPGVGVVPSKSVVAVGLLLLGLALLVAIARNAGESARRNERRRKFRIMADPGGQTVEAEDQAHGHGGLAAPLAAAAAGAAAAGVIAYAHAQDDHAHGQDDHGHDDHSHDDHDHAPAVAQDDHGHTPAAAHADDSHRHDDLAQAPVATLDDHDLREEAHGQGQDDRAHDDPGHAKDLEQAH